MNAVVITLRDVARRARTHPRAVGALVLALSLGWLAASADAPQKEAILGLEDGSVTITEHDPVYARLPRREDPWLPRMHDAPPTQRRRAALPSVPRRRAPRLERPAGPTSTALPPGLAPEATTRVAEPTLRGPATSTPSFLEIGRGGAAQPVLATLVAAGGASPGPVAATSPESKPGADPAESPPQHTLPEVAAGPEPRITPTLLSAPRSVAPIARVTTPAQGFDRMPLEEVPGRPHASPVAIDHARVFERDAEPSTGTGEEEPGEYLLLPATLKRLHDELAPLALSLPTGPPKDSPFSPSDKWAPAKGGIDPGMDAPGLGVATEHAAAVAQLAPNRANADSSAETTPFASATSVTVAPMVVPEPSTTLLLGVGLAALASAARRRPTPRR